jgi:hypothetical protein
VRNSIDHAHPERAPLNIAAHAIHNSLHHSQVNVSCCPA